MPRVLLHAIKAKPVDVRIFTNEIGRAMDDEVKPDLLAYLNRIVADWEHQPTFKATKHVTATMVSVDVKPTGENADIWRYVTKGTPPHTIKPKVAKALRFEWGGPGSYKPRTTTAGGYHGPGQVVGGKPVSFKVVHHPGTKARNFEKHIARWYAPKFRQIMRAAVQRGMRKAKQKMRAG